MKGKIFFLPFFILFTLASLAIPVPMFPGSMISAWFQVPLGSALSSLLSAAVNGSVYGCIIWLISGLAFKAGSIGSSVSLVESKNRAEDEGRSECEEDFKQSLAPNDLSETLAKNDRAWRHDVSEVAVDVDQEMDNIVEKRSQPDVDSALLVVADETRGVSRPGCPYHFGYLKNHLRNIPDECLMCPDLMKCLG